MFDSQQIARRNTRVAACGTLVIVIVAGLLCKAYRGTGHVFINDFGPASLAYVLAWMLLGFVFFPDRHRIASIATIVLLGTCLVECSQLLQFDWLARARRVPAMRILLGTTFSWWDFPAYVLGAVVGIYLLDGISRQTGAPSGDD